MASGRPAAGGGQEGPAILVIGGFPTDWRWYTRFCGLLCERSAPRVELVRITLADWFRAAWFGLSAITSTVADAMDRLADEDGRPILVVGHSAGGIVARLAQADACFEGARRARTGAVGAVVTLGTPHSAERVDGTYGQHGRRALAFLARHDPLPRRAKWLSVGSSWTADDHPGTWARQLRRALALRCYEVLLGPRGRNETGDGMVPLTCAPLTGADRHMDLEGFAHGPFLWGKRWYGSADGIERWWGVAMDLWSDVAAP